MQKVFAFALLALFGILLLAGCLFLFIVPQSLAEPEFRAPSSEDPVTRYLPWIFMGLAFVFVAIAYVGSYLVVRYRANGYLSDRLGYSKIVRFGFILQMVVCIPFLLAWWGGMPGTIFTKILVVVLLLAPFVIRLVYLKMQPDKTFEGFLMEEDV
jgi:hypothetical protein